jgi:hypothetical protein
MMPVILYDNRFADAVPTATDTASGSDVRLACDLRAYTAWQAASVGAKYITVDCAAAQDADALAMIGHNCATGEIDVSVESSADGANWTQRLAPARPATNRAFLLPFTRATARYWRVKLAAGLLAPTIGEVALGARMTFPQPPTPPYTPYTEEVQADSTVGKAGHILGSVIRYKRLSISARWTNLDRSWVLGTFLPFWDQYASDLNPFFWAWDLTYFPTHVYHVAIDPARGRYATPMTLSMLVDSLALDMTGVKELVADAPYTPPYVAPTGIVLVGGTVVWPEDAVSVTVSGTFPATYQVEATAAWNANGVWATDKGTSSFVLRCANPPDADSACDWWVEQ